MTIRSNRRMTKAIVFAVAAGLCTPGGARDTGRVDPRFGDGGVSAFYSWTEAKPPRPGAMLRQEEVRDGFYADHASVARRILYSTTDGRFGGGIVASSGLIYLPKGPMPAGGWPLLVFGHGTTGIADVCAPSWQKPLPRDGYFVDQWLQKGYAVVAPDYQGLGTPGVHPYLSRAAEGYSVLDAVRAALAAYPQQIANRVIMAGQSQGSGAVLAATYFAPSYAPGVRLLGTIATGNSWSAPLRPGEVDSLTTAPESPRLNILRILGGGTPANGPTPDSLLSDKGKVIAEAARTQCSRALTPIARQIGLTPDNAYTRPPRAVSALIEPSQAPRTPLRTPVFIGTGMSDTLIPPARQFGGAQAMCKAGSTIIYRTYDGVTHNGSLTAALADGQAFAADRLAGRPVVSNCAGLREPGPIQPPSKDDGKLFND